MQLAPSQFSNDCPRKDGPRNQANSPDGITMTDQEGASSWKSNKIGHLQRVWIGLTNDMVFQGLMNKLSSGKNPQLEYRTSKNMNHRKMHQGQDPET